MLKFINQYYAFQLLAIFFFFFFWESLLILSSYRVSTLWQAGLIIIDFKALAFSSLEEKSVQLYVYRFVTRTKVIDQTIHTAHK